MEPLIKITSKIAALPLDNIDTDQIIPARFLKVTDKKGLGNHLFADWRYDKAGNPQSDFLLNKPEIIGLKILFAGQNFGCGSSREHAPWALTDFGFQVIIAESFGDIFRNNALKNGLLPVQVDPEVHNRIKNCLNQNPSAEWTIDLEKQVLIFPDQSSIQFHVDSFSKSCLINGVDELGYLLTFLDKIIEYESQKQK
ncbi:3-isopropylmalate dehydratase small subunit [Flexilinea flocculi]|jgi:3-isopropylmalate/(R)-2-methylmalate dehydratase small subunit|uniref:3-isopropylmalate dehydratase small subunit n=1 Tax=Flexilinea flocculi TaxID=1678840 RepID=A0A0S7BWX6_9CHLR|nr:3-isopropylmalate dehydratase small subunit [Flexilinea flocculi]NMB93359.1 3-isopropylmalate dehydratase small subunit [Flexilinea flocculi]GAP41096.1 3-isopropylmalate dehydratase, small subunit [Flexilinea flocculi]